MYCSSLPQNSTNLTGAKGMIHPDTEVRFIDEQKGNGLFATRFIPCGTITWSLDQLDREITQAEMDRYSPLYQEILLKYSFRDKKGNYIFCWDNGRFINHSFQANCCLTPYNFEIAVRDIKAGEEVTDDYGYLNIIEPFEAAAENGDRSVVYPDDLLRYADRWDSQLEAAFPLLLQVEQPLQKYIQTGTWETVMKILQGETRMASIKHCYFEPAVSGK